MPCRSRPPPAAALAIALAFWSEGFHGDATGGATAQAMAVVLRDSTELTGEVASRATLAAALLRVGAGDRDAFALLYRLTSAKLFGICLRILSTGHEAEEALQDAYLTIWRRAPVFDPARGGAMTWLAVVTRNVAIDRLRARRAPGAPIEAADEVADPAPLAVDQLVAAGEAHQLGHCLETLRPVDAVFIRTAFFEGATYAELATRARQPLATVKSRIRRALMKLRECLE